MFSLLLYRCDYQLLCACFALIIVLIPIATCLLGCNYRVYQLLCACFALISLWLPIGRLCFALIIVWLPLATCCFALIIVWLPIATCLLCYNCRVVKYARCIVLGTACFTLIIVWLPIDMCLFCANLVVKKSMSLLCSKHRVATNYCNVTCLLCSTCVVNTGGYVLYLL